MTLDEALAEIGVTGDATAEEARRAYLRGLKLHKPEQDPEGFRRLRDAYDLVKAAMEARRLPMWSMSQVMVTTPPRAQPQAPEGVPVMLPVDPREDADDAPSPPSDPAPPPAPPAPLVRLDEFFRLLSNGKPRLAARLLGDIYQEATVDVALPVPPARVALDLLFRLHETDSTKTAARLERRFRRWLRAYGNETRTLGDGAARWVLVRELGALPPGLPAETRVALVHAARDGNVTAARSELASLQRIHPVQARADASLLRQHAPLLAASVASALDPFSGPPAPKVPTKKGLSTWWVVLIVIVQVGAALSRAATSSAPASEIKLPAPLNATLSQPTTDEARNRYAVAADAVDKLAQHEWNERLDRSIEIRDALRRRDCAFVLQNLDNIVDRTDPLAVDAVSKARAACASEGVPSESTGAAP